MARQRVREQIENDKLARKEMFGGAAKPAASPSSAPSTTNSSQPKKDYDTTRIQVSGRSSVRTLWRASTAQSIQGTFGKGVF